MALRPTPTGRFRLNEVIVRLSLLATLSFLVLGPAVAQDKATMEKLNDAFVTAFSKGDFATVGSMYTEDAYLLPPGSAMFKGRTNVTAFWTTARLTTVDVKPLGNEAAREVGTFSLMTRGQQPQQLTGKYVVVWQKVGSDWKLTTSIWNSDK
jgi:ketosteroid isomerase-like protein